MTQIIKKIVFLEKDTNKVVSWREDQRLGHVEISDLPLKTEEGTADYRMYADTTLFNVIKYETNSGILTSINVSPKEDLYDVIQFNESNLPQNDPVKDWTYNATLNAFIPPCPMEEFVFDETTLEWKPDPEKTYDLHGDGKLYRYDVEISGWIPTW